MQSGEDGTVTLPAITDKLALCALVQENEKGTQSGKDYGLSRSYCALTIEMI